jgi:P27 family predicted phage terminase small subunit
MAGTSRSGRRRNPESIRMLTGARTRTHHKSEPRYEKGMPSPPPFIESDEIAARKWHSLAPRIANAGVLTEAHGEMLALLCSAWADLERAREQFKTMNYQQLVVDVVNGANGEQRRKVKTNPLINQIEKNAYQVARFLGEFGLTPMTSAKVVSEKASDDDDPFAEFLNSENPYKAN